VSLYNGELLKLLVLVDHQLVGHVFLVNVSRLFGACDFCLVIIDELHWDAIDNWL